MRHRIANFPGPAFLFPKKPVRNKGPGSSCGFDANSCLLLNKSLPLSGLQSLGLYNKRIGSLFSSVRLRLYPVWLPEVGSRKVNWQQALRSLHLGQEGRYGWQAQSPGFSPYSVQAKWIKDIIALGIPNITYTDFSFSFSFCSLRPCGSCHLSHLYMSMQKVTVKPQQLWSPGSTPC